MTVRKTIPKTREATGPQDILPYPITPISPKSLHADASAPSEDLNLRSPSSEIDDAGEATQGTISAYQAPSENFRKAEEKIRNADGIALPPILQPGGGRTFPNSGKKQDIPAVLKVGSTEPTPRSSWESQRSTGNIIGIDSPQLVPRGRPAPDPSMSVASRNPYRDLNGSAGKVFMPAQLSEENDRDVLGRNQNVLSSQEMSPTSADAFAKSWIASEAPHTEFNTARLVKDQEPLHTQDVLDSVVAPTRKTLDHHTLSSPLLDLEATSQSTIEPLDPHAHNASSHAQNLGRNNTFNLDNRIQNMKITPDIYSEHTAPPLQTEDINPTLPPKTLTEREEYPPLQPPRPRSSQSTQENPPPQPPRPPKVDGTGAALPSDVQNQRDESTKAKRARETYQIRHVNWHDFTSHSNPRQSPIMVQNANGPCPLLALVNALVLSTPAGSPTALVETLRVREQISLGFLLDAVIDELIGRNGDLPDVSDMYTFLVTLHTGMNVNPRFVPLEHPLNLMDAPIGQDLATDMHGSRKAGGFEGTREMMFYSTFAIPLIHGWIPPRNHPAFAALQRTAATYEDAQNLMFREEELEEKLQRQGLSSDEQATLEDIGSVKYYLSSTATQLTGYGLDTITETMKPGSVSILFRNDHFSTLYRHPRSGQLLTLVTDMGYAGHDEVVWESLVDVSGEGSEFFSGDFRPVSNVIDDNPPPQPHDEGEWTTVPSRSRTSNQRKADESSLPSNVNVNDTSSIPLSPNTEQEDHDLALAMQLQEEEEERDRQTAADRRREDELSQNYLNSADASGRRTFPGFGRGATGARGGPSPPPRGRGSGREAPVPSQPIPPTDVIDTEDAPPPTYEQAAKGPVYHPPQHHPAHPRSSPNAIPPANSGNVRPLPARPRQSSAYSEHASSYTGSPPQGQPKRGHGSRSSGSAPIRGGGIDPGLVRRRSGAPTSAVSVDHDRRDKDCVIM